MELIVSDVSLPQQIDFNYEELKKELFDKCKTYTTLVYTAENIKQAKSDKANLNKLKKALNDERIRREREYMKPFNDFKEKINEIISIIDEPVEIIDEQIQEYEEKRKTEKRYKIGELFFSIENKPDWLKLNKIADEKWLNASVSMKAVEEDMNQKIEQINSDLETLNGLSEFSFEAIDEYKRTLDLNRAIAEGQRLADIQRRKQEQEEREKEIAKEKGIAEREDFKKEFEEMKETVEVEELPFTPEEEAEWISFSAKLTVTNAKALKEFFNNRNIEFKAI